jgi:CO/xanthine dehydrogenase Mo-binding subunit
VDESAAQQLPGVLRMVRDGSFLAAIADSEAQAVRAREALQAAATWQNNTALPDQDALFEQLLNAPSQAYPVVDGAAVDRPPGTAHNVQRPGPDEIRATYLRPFHMHAALGPSAAVALVQEGKLTVWCHSQSVFTLREALAHVLGMDAGDVRVIHVPGAGCYGHNGADDAALDAALLARELPGHPVSLTWMREDEHAWEPYGPAMAVQLTATLDEAGAVSSWRHDVWSYPHVGRPRGGSGGTSGLLAAWHLARPFAPPPRHEIFAPHFGAYRNAEPLYSFPRQIVDHFVADSPLRTSSLRGLGALANVFALESFVDELALAAGQDPLAFRLAHLDDPRARAVLQTAAEGAGWQEKVRPSGDGYGRGLAFARYKNRAAYAAVVVDVHVDGGDIHLQQALIAADAGEIVNPDGLSNQLEGGFMQAASWTLYEQVQFEAAGITSRDWDTYPVLRFPAAPRLQTVLLDRPGSPFLGAGEVMQGPTPAAIANAVFDATGRRLRRLPLKLGS